jgi:CRP-like cAMP-binding protein
MTDAVPGASGWPHHAHTFGPTRTGYAAAPLRTVAVAQSNRHPATGVASGRTFRKEMTRGAPQRRPQAAASAATSVRLIMRGPSVRAQAGPLQVSMTALADPTTLEPSRLGRVRQQLAEPMEAFASIWNNRALRRLEYAWVGSVVGTWAFTIALGVYAYGKGGAAAVGLAGLIRTLPTVFFAPFVAGLGDRYPRVRVMVASDLARGALYAIGALCIITDGPTLLVYIIAGAVMLAASAFRPAQAALLPTLTETPQQLTAMNVVSSTVESVGFFMGPALGGILLAATSAEVVFFASGLSCIWSAGLLVGMREVRAEPATADAERSGGGFLRESVVGFRTIGSDKRLFTLVSLFTAQTVVAGALNVFIVVLALQLYDSGPAGVGTLNAATGIGGVIGAAVAAALIGGDRLAHGFAFGLIFWGVPLVLVGGVPAEVMGLFGLAVIGVANTVIDVSGFTLLQRAVPDEVLARVFGVLETVLIAGIGLGALITPVIIDALGTRGALLVVGGFLPLLTLVAWTRLRALDGVSDAPREHVDLLTATSLFKAFSPTIIERLASKLERQEIAPGEVVIREGDPGERFYVVSHGHFAVDVGGEERAMLGPGDFFGEIALLRDVPRTATVAAQGEGGVLLSLGRDDFVPAVRMELLKSLALFRPLPPPTVEFLASRLEYEELTAGDVVLREGDDGDRFYVIAEGRVAVEVGGEARADLGRGDFFGEIALLRNVKRTATVVALEDSVVFSLRRDDFVPAVTGSAPSNAAADEVVGARLGALARRPALRG